MLMRLFLMRSASLIIAANHVSMVVPAAGESPPAIESGPLAIRLFQKFVASSREDSGVKLLLIA